MAFATANVRTGSSGDLHQFAGEWSGSVGDTSGTITLKGGRVYLVNFYNQDATSQEDRPTPVDVSVTTGTITLTVHNHVDVTNGRFYVLYL